jgi:alanine racemase
MRIKLRVNKVMGEAAMSEPFFPSRAWIEIDLDAVAANYRAVRRFAAPCARVACVLKGDAYGHGAARVARRLAAEGADFFAVSSVREGVALRRAGLAGSVLVMGPAERALLPAALEAGLTLTLGSVAEARALGQAAAARGEPATAHVKIDAGFHRLGLPIHDPETPRHVREIFFTPYVLVEGIYAHLSLRTAAHDAEQAAAMHALCAELQRGQCAPALLHLVDSIGMVRYPQWHHNLVRVGALLYGERIEGGQDDQDNQSGQDDQGDQGGAPAVKPALRLCAAVARVHWAGAGAYIGYDETHPLPRDTRIATLGIGYADGYPRAMADAPASVAIAGRRAPVLGRVCMDQTMVDVTDIPAAGLGDTAELLGREIGLDEYAAWARTNRNESLARLSWRPQRVYLQGGQVLAVDDALLGEGFPP